MGLAKQGLWGLIQGPLYSKQLDRISSKHRSQIARKSHDLMNNPRPGGSRTTLKGYDGLCRAKSGEFRIIYAYNDTVVQLLAVSRRDERNYDDLDELEIKELEGFQGIAGSGVEHVLPEWTEIAPQWFSPKPKPAELLPERITAALLDELSVPAEFRSVLLPLTTADSLLDSETVPVEIRERVLERLCPRKAIEDLPPAPVVVLADLLDAGASMTTGPIDASDAHEKSVPAKAIVRERVEAGSDKGTSGAQPLVRPPLVLISTTQRDPMKPYRGNTSRGIGKEARYTVKLDGTIQLLYTVGQNEQALLTTDDHQELVELVNEAKRRGGSTQGGGGFLINEYRHVIVPTQSEGTLFAGRYTRDLEFSFNGSTVSPVAPSGILPGALWPGPHAGIKYTLAAGASDVRYEEQTIRGTVRIVKLTDHHSAAALSGLLQSFRAVKPNGGAIYINEARELFAPVDDGTGYKRRYIGHLGSRPWFPEPV
jgi:mRNA-degrading endonuclease RelE of RelBE toxin-antitoxin system